MEATAAPPQQDFTSHLAALHRAGYGADLHPIIPPGATLTPNSKLSPTLLGKTPGRYSGDGRPGWFGYDWSKGPPARADTFYSLKHGGSLGTLTRDLPFLDCDILDAELSDAILQVVRNSLDAHASPLRAGRAPKFALPFRREGDRFKKLVLRLERGGEQVGIVELLADGQQIVIAGRHPSGSDYAWRAPDGTVGGLDILAATPVSSLPVISPEIVREKLLPALVEKLAPLGVSVTCGGGGSATSAKAVDQATLLAPSVDDVRALVAAMENEAEHKQYIEIARAIRGAVGESESAAGFEVFEEWAGRGKDGTGGRHPTSAVWESLRPPHALGWSALQSYARAAGVNTAPHVFEAELDAAPPSDLPPHIADFNARYALVRQMASTVLHVTDTGPEFLPIEHWRTLTRPEKIDGKVVSGLWLDHPARRVFRKMTMDPARPPFSAVVVPSDLPDFNLWPGFAVQPSTEGSCDLFLQHLRDVVASGNPEMYGWVLQWLAAMVQAPERLTGTALVLRGAMGSGKSYVGEVIGSLLGSALYSKVSKPAELTGEFNRHHQGKILLQVEEGFFAGDKSAVGALKHMITSDRVRIRPMYQEAYEIPNFCRLLITSNEEWVIPAGLSERRFTVLDISAARKDDWSYHAAMRGQMAAGGNARLMQALLDTPIDWELLSRPFNTEALRDQQLESLDAERRWVFDILHEAAFPNGEADSDGLYRSYTDFLRAHSAGRRASREAMGRLLRAYAKQRRLREGASRRTVYAFRPLAQCRAAFAEGLALPPSWEGPTDWPTTDEILKEVMS